MTNKTTARTRSLIVNWNWIRPRALRSRAGETSSYESRQSLKHRRPCQRFGDCADIDRESTVYPNIEPPVLAIASESVREIQFEPLNVVLELPRLQERSETSIIEPMPRSRPVESIAAAQKIVG
jgi:hypothetical protein